MLGFSLTRPTQLIAQGSPLPCPSRALSSPPALAVVAAVFLLPGPALRLPWASQVRFADMILANATIYTADPARPFAAAMAVRSGRVLRVGTYDSVKELKGRNTYELNLSGNVVLPGFIDSHVHLIDGGLQLARVPIRGVRSKDVFISRVKEAVRDKQPGQWVRGGGWNNDFWGGDFPTAAWLDEISPDNPVWLSRMDGHMGVANSLAMKIAGIDKNTNDPVGGTVVRTTEREPNGLLVDAAMKLVLDVIPDVSEIDERREALLRASAHALMRGVTTVVDVGSYFPGMSENQPWQDFSDIYEWAHSMGKMTIRVCLFFPLPTWSRVSDLIHEKGRLLSEWIHVGGVKAFLDGSLGSSSALFYEPYKDGPGSFGLQLIDMDALLNATLESDKSGLQVAVHAIGDKANDMLLDMLDEVVNLNGMRDRRFRIEHAQHLSPSAAKRFREHNTIASVQPDHLLDDADSAGKKIGVQRAERSSYLFRSLLSGGARLAFGSDWPVSDINPLQAIKTAMSRKPPGWEVPWISTECLSLEESLKAHTISAAHACFLDPVLGSLSQGKYADFVVLPSTSWGEFSQDVPGHVLATYVNGKQAYP